MRKEKDVVVLLAEDNNGHSELIKMNLLRSGLECRVLEFNNGERLLDYIESGSGQADTDNYFLLLDLGLPVVDGFEVLRRIKRDQELMRMPVIVFSSSDNDEDVRQCYSLGCSSFITKPIDYGKFVGTIRRIGDIISKIEFPQMQCIHG